MTFIEDVAQAIKDLRDTRHVNLCWWEKQPPQLAVELMTVGRSPNLCAPHD